MKRINRNFLHFIVIFQFGPKAARSLVHEFDSIVRLELGCILDEVNNHPDAAELEWALDNLLAAYDARIDISDRKSGGYG